MAKHSSKQMHVLGLIGSAVFSAAIALPATLIAHASPLAFNYSGWVASLNTAFQMLIKSYFWWGAWVSLALTLVGVAALVNFNKRPNGSDIAYSQVLGKMFHGVFDSQLFKFLLSLIILGELSNLISFATFDPSGHVRLMQCTAFFLFVVLEKLNAASQFQLQCLNKSSGFINTLQATILFSLVAVCYLLPAAISMFAAAHFFHTPLEVVAGLALGMIVSIISDYVSNWPWQRLRFVANQSRPHNESHYEEGAEKAHRALPYVKPEPEIKPVPEQASSPSPSHPPCLKTGI